MDKYEKILKLIKAVNDKYPEYKNSIYVQLYEDGSGTFEGYQRDSYSPDTDTLIYFCDNNLSDARTLDDLFVEYGIE